MDETARLLLWLALAGTAVTFAGSAAIWFMDEERRIRRAFRHVLQAPADALITANGRGVGFNFARNLAAVAWDQGAWCLVYRIDELVGAELIVDGEVRARAYRGEARRALERTTPTGGQITLRLVFDDARYPDFEVALWSPGDEARRNAPSPAEAIQEANRWIARVEAILRRAAPRQSAAAAPTVATPAPSPPRVAPPSLDPPPWDEEAEPAPPRPAATARREPPREPRTRDLFEGDEDEAFT
ncbi:hypothetical protein [Phenylobacterium sp.]|uniref:hypothetical protein n=1 Tax=Phenylobacterium sp. TaxID=1871053 RepID=UPI0027312050|nr:hypothetical protein [Phenylobacterium sp.]MDP1618635.1 hypothetical protein [Phenylobacterium sp.]MDP1987502.1 hypothetical protein [Phenylobacterium sp.]